MHFWKRCPTQPQNVVVERNWIVNCDRGIGLGLGDFSGGHNGGASAIRNNVVYNSGEGPYTDVGIGLENAAVGDLHLVPAAADAIDRGGRLDDATDDVDGDARPKLSAWDAGADEYAPAWAEIPALAAPACPTWPACPRRPSGFAA